MNLAPKGLTLTKACNEIEDVFNNDAVSSGHISCWITEA